MSRFREAEATVINNDGEGGAVGSGRWAVAAAAAAAAEAAWRWRLSLCSFPSRNGPQTPRCPIFDRRVPDVEHHRDNTRLDLHQRFVRARPTSCAHLTFPNMRPAQSGSTRLSPGAIPAQRFP